MSGLATPTRTRHAWRDRLLLRPLAWLLTAFFRDLSWEEAQAAGARLGRLLWHLSRRDRRRALDHLALAFPELDARRRRDIARATFDHLGTTLAECLHLADKESASVLRRVASTGWEAIDEAKRQGRPVLVVTGHCGNWELLAAWLGCRGLPLHVVARRLEDPYLDRLLLSLRARFGSTTIQRGEAGSARALLRAVRGSGGLGMLIAQDTRVDGDWVPFFGRPAFTPLGAADLALRFDAAVVTAFIERQDDGHHQVTIEPTGPLPTDPVVATAALTAAIERQVRRRPEQWVWFHRRWRTKPPASGQLPTASP